MKLLFLNLKNLDLKSLKRKKDLESCKSCKFSSYGLFYCCLYWYDKSYSWDCGFLKKALSGFYGPYV